MLNRVPTMLIKELVSQGAREWGSTITDYLALRGINAKWFKDNCCRLPTMSLDKADYICCCLGTHIGLVWPDYWLDETEAKNVA